MMILVYFSQVLVAFILGVRVFTLFFDSYGINFDSKLLEKLGPFIKFHMLYFPLPLVISFNVSGQC